MEWLFALFGFILGSVLTSSEEGVVLFSLMGAVVALIISRYKQQKRLTALEQGLEALRERLQGDAEQPGDAAVSPESDEEGRQDERFDSEASFAGEEPSQERVVREPISETVLDDEALTLDLEYVVQQLDAIVPDTESALAEEALSTQRSEPPARTSTQRPPNLLQRGVTAARAWLMAGNPLLKVGLLLLFLGLAFLLRYAAERITVPIEFRYVGVAAVALVLLLIGWRLRLKNTAYALSLQGGGVAVLYLTVFAALHLHQLLSPLMAFSLLLVVVICATVLAVAQNALALALVCTAGGFAVPLLTAVDNHLSLFSYYLLLNLGIVGVAWHKAWRPLNLVGFIGTFSIGLWWGLRYYQPELWLQTELFLVLLFLLYVFIGLLFAHRKLRQDSDAPPDATLTALMRWAAGRTDYIDATLMFGPPLVGFGMQYAIVSRFELGPAYSAMLMGLFYLGLAMVLWRRMDRVRNLLVEVYLALGVIFGTLSVPLALDAQWTSAIWAVEGAGIYWVSLRQHRTLSRLFALLLQGGAVMAFLPTLSLGEQTVLQGAYLSALMIGLALLFSHDRVMRSDGPVWRGCQSVDWLLVLVGFGMLYLLPALLFSLDSGVMVWALAGLVTLYIGLRLARYRYLVPAFAIQLVACGLFLLQLTPEDSVTGGAVFESGWQGLFSAMLICASLLAGAWLALRDRVLRETPRFSSGSTVLVVIGLGLMNLAVLFVLPWQSASGVWAVSGLAILWMGGMLGHRPTLFFGLAIQLVGGVVFLQQILDLQLFASGAVFKPLSGAFFWSPVALSLVAFFAAYLLQRQARANADNALFGQWRVISDVALIWGAGWWAYTLHSQVTLTFSTEYWSAYLLLGATLSCLLWSVPVKRLVWTSLGMLGLMLAPVGTVILLLAIHTDYHPAAHLGWIGWLSLFGAHFWMLKRLEKILPEAFVRTLHLVGIWLLLAVVSLELRYQLMALAEQHNAWRWLGWASVPSLYIVLMTFVRRLPWPVSAFEQEYRVWAVVPMAGILAVWLLAAMLFSDGSALPLPYLPLLNPLAISLLLVTFSLYHWCQIGGFCLRWPAGIQRVQVTSAVSLFLILTTEVFRIAHQWLAIPFELSSLLASLPVQVGLSLLWTLMALAAMVFGTRREKRAVWIAGAALIAVVVLKLFLVELSQHGSIERILSFIGVGVLLLVVGYFSPLPPKSETVLEEQAGE